jgi:hypothetical protein
MRRQPGAIRSGCARHILHRHQLYRYNALLFTPKPAATANTSLHLSIPSCARMLYLAIAAAGRYAQKEPLSHADQACVY